MTELHTKVSRWAMRSDTIRCASMPRTYVNDSPAVRFLERGEHLMRLQGRVVNPIFAETASEHQEIKDTVISVDTDMKRFVRDTMSRMTKSKERWEDIDLMFQLFLCRYIDNFQIFVEELIRDAVRLTPTLVDGLKSAKVDEDLPTDEKLERRLELLAFMGFKRFSATLTKVMGFEVFGDPALAERVAYLYDIRNLITHNYGIVHRHFLRRYPSCGVSLGDTFPLRPDFIKQAFEDLIATSADVQRRAQTKFGLFYETSVQGKVEWWER